MFFLSCHAKGLFPRCKSSPSGSLGRKSTAWDVVQFYLGEDSATALPLAGKVAVVTGGNSGIGCETTKALAAAGCKVYMATRSVEAGKQAVAGEIVQLGKGGYAVPQEAASSRIVVSQLDLEDLRSIRTFADEVLKEPRLDYLVLNAGIMAPPLGYTPNGWERQMGVNHFGHFALTQMLRGRLQSQSYPSRVVVLASTAHSIGKVDVGDLHYSKGRRYSAWGAYGQSKKANILFTKELADQLQQHSHSHSNNNKDIAQADSEAKGKVTAVCVHPGVIGTNLSRYLPGPAGFIFSRFLSDKTVPQGAATTLYGCLDPAVPPGAYLKDCAVALPDAEARDEERRLRQQLWTVTDQQVTAALARNGLLTGNCSSSESSSTASSSVAGSVEVSV